MDEFKSLRIIGCGGHARSVADIALDNTADNVEFYDECAQKDEKILQGKFFVKPLKELKIRGDSLPIFVAVGDNNKREQYFRDYSGLNIVSVISKRSYISSFAEIGRGTFVGNFVHIGPEVKVGENCIINNGAVIDHECVIGNSVHISVGARICGRTRIGNRTMIGAGATVIDKVTICSDVIIGAGATVISDITEKGTYAGVPARKIK